MVSPLVWLGLAWLRLVVAIANVGVSIGNALVSPLVWPWFGLGLAWFRLGLAWFRLGLAWFFLWFRLGLAWFLIGFALVSHWFRFGFALVLPWCPLGFVLLPCGSAAKLTNPLEMICV